MRQDLDSHWRRWLNSDRRRPRSGQGNLLATVPAQTRTAIERDYDRVLFSTPVRRMADKTQVFPLDRSDSVRTRLTHSHEVANLARSVGIDLVFHHGVAAGLPEALRDVPACWRLSAWPTIWATRRSVTRARTRSRAGSRSTAPRCWMPNRP